MGSPAEGVNGAAVGLEVGGRDEGFANGVLTETRDGRNGRDARDGKLWD